MIWILHGKILSWRLGRQECSAHLVSVLQCCIRRSGTVEREIGWVRRSDPDNNSQQLYLNGMPLSVDVGRHHDEKPKGLGQLTFGWFASLPEKERLHSLHSFVPSSASTTLQEHPSRGCMLMLKMVKMVNCCSLVLMVD